MNKIKCMRCKKIIMQRITKKGNKSLYCKECVLEDVMEIIDEMGNFNCGFMDGELCERIDKEKLKQKIEELK